MSSGTVPNCGEDALELFVGKARGFGQGLGDELLKLDGLEFLGGPNEFGVVRAAVTGECCHTCPEGAKFWRDIDCQRTTPFLITEAQASASAH